MSQLELVVDEIVIDRPKNLEQYLCSDKGYSGELAEQAVEERSYIFSIKNSGENKSRKRRPIPVTKPADELWK